MPYKLSVYIPSENVPQVKQAMFNAGAGKIGHYEHCCWQTTGTGQFKPLAGSNPHIGNIEQLETVEECLVELVCSDECIKPAIEAMIAAHPYETPAYAVYPILQLEDFQ